MKFVRLHGTGELQIHDEPVPVVGARGNLAGIKRHGVRAVSFLKIMTSNHGS